MRASRIVAVIGAATPRSYTEVEIPFGLARWQRLR
jgi:hypothetical protein